MDAPLAAPDALVRPWRRATIVASLIAAIELVVLLVAGFAILAKPLAHAVRQQAQVRAFAPVKQAPPVARTVVTAPRLTRVETTVLVLNGNGRSGAASDASATLRGLGYTIRGTANAARADYATSVVMYRPGYAAEGQRLARDLRLKVVGPLDGITVRALKGAKLVLILGVG